MADHRELEAFRVLLLIVHSLIDDPTTVQIEILLGTDRTTFNIIAPAPKDAACVIGRQGRMARSIRTVMAGIGRKARWRYLVTIDGEYHPLKLANMESQYRAELY